uniref:Uncharacterized protein n=1 Tax=Arundo donax TaxID=35708 RepID=A0A0A9BGX4_ARUDO
MDLGGATDKICTVLFQNATLRFIIYKVIPVVSIQSAIAGFHFPFSVHVYLHP